MLFAGVKTIKMEDSLPAGKGPPPGPCRRRSWKPCYSSTVGVKVRCFKRRHLEVRTGKARQKVTSPSKKNKLFFLHPGKLSFDILKKCLNMKGMFDFENLKMCWINLLTELVASLFLWIWWYFKQCHDPYLWRFFDIFYHGGSVQERRLSRRFWVGHCSWSIWYWYHFIFIFIWHVYIYIHIYIYTCNYIYTWLYNIYIYIHTYIHTYIIWPL